MSFDGPYMTILSWKVPVWTMYSLNPGTISDRKLKFNFCAKYFIMNIFVALNVFIRINSNRLAVIGQSSLRSSALILIGVLILTIPTVTHSLYAQIATAGDPEIPGSNFSGGSGAPNVTNPTLKADLVFKGLEFPTNMALLGPDDFLVLEKSKGTVNRIVNGAMLADPLLRVNVASEVERGMLGIAVSNATNQTNVGYNNLTTPSGPYVFLVLH